MAIYEKIYFALNRYMLIGQYYSDHPEEIFHRGFKNKLFKRDYVGEILEKFSDVQLLDYGFIYKRDKNYLYKNSKSIDIKNLKNWPYVKNKILSAEDAIKFVIIFLVKRKKNEKHYIKNI